jgi:UDP-N-acetylglucosamine 2-epimerase (non-hydrolysing)
MHDADPAGHTKLVDVIAGARPNFMKISPLLRALDARIESGSRLRYRLVHTGQHYDASMSAEFFEQLGIPSPDVNLNVGSGTQAEQTAAIMLGYEELLLRAPSHLCIVVGDVNSTMACAIVARKLQIPVAHVEAGIRSGDWSMPEEINRVVTDSITNWFFTTTDLASENLRRGGVPDERIFFVGNIMIDTLLANEGRLRAPPFWKRLGLETGEYFVLTMHRPHNVDGAGELRRTIGTIVEAARGLPVVFPAHPRAKKALAAHDLGFANLHLVEPQPYLEFNYLVKHARAVITDSGGVTEETTVLGVPCITLRDTTERPETVTIGTNELVGSNPESLRSAVQRIFSGQWKEGRIPALWDGRTGTRIASVLDDLFDTGSAVSAARLAFLQATADQGTIQTQTGAVTLK